ncbi:unnamed protein product, partial [Rotaria sp. Silwood2]
TEIVALLICNYSDRRGLLEHVRTGDGKTLIVGLTALLLALYRSFSYHICNENDEVNHQSDTSDLNSLQCNIVDEDVEAFQRDIFEEFNN